jgi:8-oxo-dGTP diphosphatase
VLRFTSGVNRRPAGRLGTVEIRAAGAIVHDERHRLLLVRRRWEPWSGRWTLPGGKCLPQETAAAACLRELLEETGLTASILRSAGVVRLPAGDDGRYLIEDFFCEPTGGILSASDDAVAAAWFDQRGLRELLLVPGLLAALTRWQALPD